MDMTGGLPPLNWASALSTWQAAWVIDVLLVLAALGYLHVAYRTLPRQGMRWPLGPTVSFLGALIVTAITVQGAIEVYGHTLFSVHMVGHLVLIMVIPVLVVLGQPIRLLSTGSEPLARRVRAVLDSRTVWVLTLPGFGLAAYAAVLVGTHLSGFMQLMLTHPWLHYVEIGLYLGSGYLFFLPLLGHEPLRRTLSYPLRVFLLLIGMTADTVVGVVLMMTATPPFAAYREQHRMWGPSPLSDIHIGGAIMWVVGDGLMFAVVALVVAQWMGDTERQNDTGKWLEAARRSALANLGVDAVDPDGATDIDDDEAALAAYNRMLARLNTTSGPGERPGERSEGGDVQMRSSAE